MMFRNRIEDTDPGEKASFLELTQTFVKEHKFVVFMALVLTTMLLSSQEHPGICWTDHLLLKINSLFCDKHNIFAQIAFL